MILALAALALASSPGHLCVVRAGSVLGAAVAMQVVVDDRAVGTLRYGRKLCVDAPAGTHVVEVSEGDMPAPLGVALGGVGYLAQEALTRPSESTLRPEVAAGETVVIEAWFAGVGGEIGLDQHDAGWLSGRDLRPAAEGDQRIRALPSARSASSGGAARAASTAGTTTGTTSPTASGGPSTGTASDSTTRTVTQLYERAGRPPPADLSADRAAVSGRLERGVSVGAMLEAAEIGGAVAPEGASLEAILAAGGSVGG